MPYDYKALLLTRLTDDRCSIHAAGPERYRKLHLLLAALASAAFPSAADHSRT